MLGAAVSACDKAEKWQEALLLLHKMAQKELAPDSIAATAALSSCAGASQWELAIHFFNHFHLWKLTIDEVMYSCCIKACAKGAQVQKSFQLLATMQLQKVMPNEICFTATWLLFEGFWVLFGEYIWLVWCLLWYYCVHLCVFDSIGYSCRMLLLPWTCWIKTDTAPKTQSPLLLTKAAAVACKDPGQWRNALALLDHCFEQRLVPNEILYEVAITSSQQANYLRPAILLLESLSARTTSSLSAEKRLRSMDLMDVACAWFL